MDRLLLLLLLPARPPHIRAPDSWLQQIARPNNINKYGPGSFSFSLFPPARNNKHTHTASQQSHRAKGAGWRSSICLTHSTLLLLLLYGWPSLTLRIYFHWQVFSSRVQRGERSRGRNGREEKGAPKFLFFFWKRKKIVFFFSPILFRSSAAQSVDALRRRFFLFKKK